MAGVFAWKSISASILDSDAAPLLLVVNRMHQIITQQLSPLLPLGPKLASEAATPQSDSTILKHIKVVIHEAFVTGNMSSSLFLAMLLYSLGLARRPGGEAWSSNAEFEQVRRLMLRLGVFIAREYELASSDAVDSLGRGLGFDMAWATGCIARARQSRLSDAHGASASSSHSAITRSIRIEPRTNGIVRLSGGSLQLDDPTSQGVSFRVVMRRCANAAPTAEAAQPSSSTAESTQTKARVCVYLVPSDTCLAGPASLARVREMALMTLDLSEGACRHSTDASSLQLICSVRTSPQR